MSRLKLFKSETTVALLMVFLCPGIAFSQGVTSGLKLNTESTEAQLKAKEAACRKAADLEETDDAGKKASFLKCYKSVLGMPDASSAEKGCTDAVKRTDDTISKFEAACKGN